MIAKDMDLYIAGGSIIRAMFEDGLRLAQRVGPENVHDFSLGNPNSPVPPEFNDAVRAVLDEEDSSFVHGYMTNAGYPDVRTAVAEDLNRRFGGDYTAENVLMTAGAAPAMNIIFRTLLDPGDEVLVFSPFFPEYTYYVRNAGGVLRPVPTDPHTFQPDPKALRAAIGPKVKALLINNPNNPTGAVYREKILRAVADVLTERSCALGRPIYLVSDEPYRELVFEGAAAPWLPSLYPNTVVGYSWSKSLSIPGERIGYLLIPSSCADFPRMFLAAMTVARTAGYVNAPSLMQRTIRRCLDVWSDVGFYDRNHRTLCTALGDMGFRFAPPEGAFYLWLKVPDGDSAAFVRRAFSHNILLGDGTGFGCSGYVRLSYCVSHERILRSLPAFENLANEYNLK